MKKLLLFVTIIIVSLQTFGQSDPIRQKLDSVFQHVDKSQISTSYLKEFGAEFMPLHWPGTLLYKCHSPKNNILSKYSFKSKKTQDKIFNNSHYLFGINSNEL